MRSTNSNALPPGNCSTTCAFQTFSNSDCVMLSLPQSLVHAAQHGAERRGRDAAIATDAEMRFFAKAQFDVRNRGRVGAGADGVLVIMFDDEIDGELAAQRFDERLDRAAPSSAEPSLRPVFGKRRVDRDGAGAVVDNVIALEIERPARREVLALERGPYFGRRNLTAARLREILNHATEFNLQVPWHVEPVVGAQDVRDAALAGLAVDANDRFIGAADILRIDRQVGNLPRLLGGRRPRGPALLDRVLMRPRKRREHQFATVGMTFVDRQPVAMLHRL